MPDFSLEWVPWPVGTDVEVYPRRSQLMLSDQPPPEQPLIATAQVQADQTLSYVGLDPDSYWAVGSVGSVLRYVAFTVHEAEQWLPA